MEPVRKQILELIEKIARFKPESGFKPESTYEPESMNDCLQLSKDLGYDSIRFMSLIVEMEELFDIQVEESFLSELYTITPKQMIDYVEKLLSRK